MKYSFYIKCSDLAINIYGKSLSATILPIVGSLGKTCSGRFQSPTDFTPQKAGYSYSFFAQRCHENIIYLQCYAIYNSTIEIYNYDINAATWKYMGSTIPNSDVLKVKSYRLEMMCEANTLTVFQFNVSENAISYSLKRVVGTDSSNYITSVIIDNNYVRITSSKSQSVVVELNVYYK